jgi:hypothetical protein
MRRAFVTHGGSAAVTHGAAHGRHDDDAEPAIDRQIEEAALLRAAPRLTKSDSHVEPSECSPGDRGDAVGQLLGTLAPADHHTAFAM